MTSDRQVEANRQNAARSTGPRTAEGRIRSRQNALRHGLTAKRLLIPGESEEEFLEFRDDLWHALAAEGATEEALAEMVVADLWRLRRGREIETGLFAHWIHDTRSADALEEASELRHRPPPQASSLNAEQASAVGRAQAARKERRAPISVLGRVFQGDAEGAGALERLTRYEGALRSRLERTLHELSRTQALRLGQSAPVPAVDVSLRAGD